MALSLANQQIQHQSGSQRVPRGPKPPQPVQPQKAHSISFKGILRSISHNAYIKMLIARHSCYAIVTL